MDLTQLVGVPDSTEAAVSTPAEPTVELPASEATSDMTLFPSAAARPGVVAATASPADAAAPVAAARPPRAKAPVVAQVRDPLGLMLDDENLFEIPPAIVLYGQPGAGKSTDVARAFSDSLFVCSNSTVLRAFASWCRDNWVEACRLGIRTPVQPNPNFDEGERESPDNPRFIMRSWAEGGLAIKTIPEYQRDGKTRFNAWETIKDLLNRYVSTCEAGTCPYNGIVFDEWSTFAGRVNTDIQIHFGRNGFGGVNEVKSFHKWLCQIPKITRRKLALVCHDVPPKYDELEGSARRGELKYPGGPKLPIGTLIKEVCSEADVVLQLIVKRNELEQVTMRRYATEVDPEWERKFRDVAINPEEELDLLKLLQRAGYNV